MPLLESVHFHSFFFETAAIKLAIIEKMHTLQHKDHILFYDLVPTKMYAYFHTHSQYTLHIDRISLHFRLIGSVFRFDQTDNTQILLPTHTSVCLMPILQYIIVLLPGKYSHILIICSNNVLIP